MQSLSAVVGSWPANRSRAACVSAGQREAAAVAPWLRQAGRRQRRQAGLGISKGCR